MNKLPSGWEVKKIKEICFIGRGRVISEKEIMQNPGNYPVYSSQTKNAGEIGKINTYDFEGEYVTWTTDGANAGTVFYRKGKFNCTNVCGTLKAKKNNINHKFLAYKLSTITKKYVLYIGNPKLMNNVMAEIKIPLPKSLKEQQKIAEILSEVDKNIEIIKKIIEKEKRIKKGLMQDLLKYGIDENGNIRNPNTHKFKKSELGIIPEEWKVKKLGELLDYEQPTRYIVKNENYDERYSIPVLTAGKSFILGYTNEKEGIYWNLPVIIFDDFTTTSKYVDFPFKVKSSAMKILKAKENISLKLIYEIMQLINFSPLQHQRHWISIYSKIKIPLPSLKEEQQKIAEILSAQDEKIEKLNKKLNKFKKIKKALMQDLLTGKIRVTKLLKDKK